MKLSVVIATYNRAAILEKTLRSLFVQTTQEFEILVVDDGSTDETPDLLKRLESEDPRLRHVRINNSGRSIARNVGIEEARGEYILFLDSDVVVVPTFVETHLAAHRRFLRRHPQGKAFCQGLSLNVDDFNQLERKPTMADFSAAYFATNNVSIPKKYLVDVGMFDSAFVEYGWEDLELGLRLKRYGCNILRSRKAIGYHYHPPFSIEDLPRLKRIEEERGRTAVLFYRKFPTLEVRLMIQLTPLHRFLNFLVTAGGLLNERTLRPQLEHLAKKNPWLAAQWTQILLNQYNLSEMHRKLAAE
jgi:glycosyltransferase involved in cell wall biosynthesis